MMNRLIAFALTLLMLSSCGGLRQNVGYYGKFCKDDLITLDGDTFRITESITPDLLIICSYPESKGKSYLLKKADTGFFYVIMEAENINSIDNTSSFVEVNENDIYDLNGQKIFSLPCNSPFLKYLGQYGKLLSFCNGDTICFSDGKCLGMNEDTSCFPGKVDGMVRFVSGARSIDVSLEELYRYMPSDAKPSTKYFERDYCIKPETEYIREGIGFTVDLDIPKSDSQTDAAIREWLMKSVKDDVFSLLGRQNEVHVGRADTYQNTVRSLDSYGVLWEKLCRNDYQVEDTLDISLYCNIRFRHVADTPDYATYYYWATLYEGGIHDMPRSYYITYDKKRQVFLNVSNTVRRSHMVKFRHEVLNMLKQWNDNMCDDDVTMESFTRHVFSFHTPVIDEDDVDEELQPLVMHAYECDAWSGWESAVKENFSYDNFPLPHLALLPEGVVISYHPYQIDCFAAGEYHAVIPYDKISSCLLYDYNEQPELFPQLSDFLKNEE